MSHVSLLEGLERTDSPNVVRTLLNREIANLHPFKKTWGKVPSTSYILDRLILRQLIVSRNSHVEESIPRVKVKAKSKSNKSRCKKPVVEETRKCTVKIVDSHAASAGRKKVFWITDMIFVHKSDGYTCYNSTPQNGRLIKKYHITTSQKWKEWETWNPPFDHPVPGIKHLGVLLFTLSKPGDKLNSFFLDNGKAYHEEVHLGDVVRYGEVLVSEQTRKLTLSSIRASLPGDILFDAIQFDILDPRSRIRFQIKSSAISGAKPKDISCVHDLLVLNFSNHVKIWKLVNLLNDQTATTHVSVEAESQNGHDTEGVAVSHIVHSLEGGIPVKNTGTGSDLMLGVSVYPPLPYFIAQGSVFDLYNQNKRIAVGEDEPDILKYLQDTAVLTEETGGNVAFMNAAPSRVIFCSKNEVCVARVRRIKNGLHTDVPSEPVPELVQEFYMKYGENLSVCPKSETVTRRSARERNRIKYTEYLLDEDDVRIVTGSGGQVDALVIMEVRSDPPNFTFHFFDSQTWTKILEIVPQGFPRIKIPQEDLADFVFDVNDAEIVVGSIGSKWSTKLFIIPLLHENCRLKL